MYRHYQSSATSYLSLSWLLKLNMHSTVLIKLSAKQPANHWLIYLVIRVNRLVGVTEHQVEWFLSTGFRRL